MNDKAGNLFRWSGVCNGMADLAASPWSLAEEVALVSAAQAGSPEAFDRLVTRYHASVYNLCYRIVGNPQDAADTVQEVFLKVHRGLSKFQGNSSLKTWIYRIAVHEGCNYRRWWRRHAQRETSMEAPTAGGESRTLGESLVERGTSPFETASSNEVRRIIDKTLLEIPANQRAAVMLRDLEDFSYEEIAGIMNVSLGTVKSRVGRGREALRKRLSKLLPMNLALEEKV